MDIVIGIVAVIDPALPPQGVAAAVRAAVPAAGRRHQLAWTLQKRPELLTGAGAEATIPAVLRLIDTLATPVPTASFGRLAPTAAG